MPLYVILLSMNFAASVINWGEPFYDNCAKCDWTNKATIFQLMTLQSVILILRQKV